MDSNNSSQPLVNIMQLDVRCYRNSLLLPCGVSWRFCAPALRFLLPLLTDLYTSASSLFGCDPQQDRPLLPSLKYLQEKQFHGRFSMDMLKCIIMLLTDNHYPSFLSFLSPQRPWSVLALKVGLVSLVTLMHKNKLK